jgi:hypothetical protein
MKIVGINNIEDVFLFIVGGKTSNWVRIRAEFFSPIVRVQHCHDRSITEFGRAILNRLSEKM